MEYDPGDMRMDVKPRETRTLTLRISAELHAQLESAARKAEQSLNQFIADAAKDAAAPSANPATPLPRVALLIDLDGFSNRDPISIDAIERVAALRGRVILKNSFATAPSSDLDASKHAVLARHVQHQDLPSREAVRLQIADSALQTLHDDAASEFVIVSADEEIAHIAALLARRGGVVTGIGVGMGAAGGASHSFLRAFEEFHDYERLARPPESAALRALRTHYAEILVLLASQSEARGAKAVGAALVQLLRHRNPELSLALLEMRNWRELAEFARDIGIGSVESSGHDFIVHATENGREKVRALKTQSERTTVQELEVTSVQSAITSILGVGLPEERTRFLVFSALQWVLNNNIASGGIPLVDLSYRVALQIGATTVPQNTVYRLMNGLFRAGAFEFEPNPDSEYNPIITALRVSATRCDDAFVLNLMRIKNKFPQHATPGAIATAFYGTAAKSDRIMSMLKLAAKPPPERHKLAALLESLSP
jgi:hypothetical protein